MLEACELFSDSDIFWGAGKKEQEVLLGACNCSIDICYSVHLFCVYNPCRQERRCNCKLFLHSSPLVFKDKIVVAIGILLAVQ
jgi:uracil-DNA glycosylase